jgi:RHS repeat-associated protein
VNWTPTLPAAQRYRIYARWTQDPNRATDAPYTVHHDGGATTVTANQEVNGGIWLALGTYAMSPGQNHRIELSDAANGRVIADAVKLVPDGNARAVVADALRFVPAETPVFAAASSSLLDETIYLNGRPLARVDGGALAYVHSDHLGTPQKMTDGTGALVWDAVFRPFGEAESITGSATNDLRFPGQLYDAETALHYNYFRDYDPSLGRYVESDPIGLGGGVNIYGYAYSNPVRWIDPNGLTSLVIPRPLPMPFPRPFPYPVDPILPVPIPDEAVPDDDLVEYCTRLYVMCTQQGWGGDWSCFDCHFYCTGNNEEWPFEHCSPDNLACISENPNGTS